MALRIPNASGAFDPIQGQPDAVDFDIITAGIGGNGVVSGCAVSAQTPAAMAVDVASGSVRINDTDVAVSSGSVNISAAHATLPRLDLIVVNDSGTLAVENGTAASVPQSPAIPADTVALAMVLVKAAVTTIVSGAITDKRVILPSANDVVKVLSVQVFTANNNWSKPTGLVFAKVVCMGGGGGGGGADADTNKWSAGGGGGGGEYSEEWFAAGDLGSTEVVVVGAGGAGGSIAGGNGGAGTSSTFGSPAKLTAAGGAAGQGMSTGSAAAPDTPNVAEGGAGGTGSSDGDLHVPGQPGQRGLAFAWSETNLAINLGGNGGNSRLGAGGLGNGSDGAGNPGLGYGGGGGGAAEDDGSGQLGGNGSGGIVIVYEYKSQ